MSRSFTSENFFGWVKSDHLSLSRGGFWLFCGFDLVYRVDQKCWFTQQGDNLSPKSDDLTPNVIIYPKRVTIRPKKFSPKVIFDHCWFLRSIPPVFQTWAVEGVKEFVWQCQEIAFCGIAFLSSSLKPYCLNLWTLLCVVISPCLSVCPITII